ncbi:universal stress protein domain-containing protein [Thermoclostridium stercorarium subsp. stercorarium DSM 8532]|uniref:Universal stress protein domain-containing protein n=2 Tax=Thermoclostridium stercorarium TaxID=1510 RepID=L7VRN6_THES1|nr:universal stress protein [Thermoclostridium stercorarium]AGC69314.1 universal stress protein domain-containing protein [Thermoclostridium stercorarium subsp. stercorarium DSM 8532]AGI40278.1 stress protein [Thermoclostridium stercorarium subsp. stercorarium DSM 8532]ANW99576.1 universal stress protein UspA [Thermoclostridium stercorarium subsp. thermolacticum DSM 2910]
MSLYQNVLVCVTKQKTCERLIKAASKLKAKNGNLRVLHVAKNSWNILDNSRESEALEYLFKVSKEYNADMTVLRSDNISKTIADFAKNNGIDLIVLGQSNNEQENKFYKQLCNLLKDEINIEVIP